VVSHPGDSEKYTGLLRAVGVADRCALLGPMVFAPLAQNPDPPPAAKCPKVLTNRPVDTQKMLQFANAALPLVPLNK